MADNHKSCKPARETVRAIQIESAAVAKIVTRVTWWGVAVNIALAALKMTGGVVGGSKALIADAVHSLSDLATDAAVLVGVRYWSAPPDKDHPYGHGKIETLVTMAIGLVLAAVGAGLGYEAALGLSAAMAGNLPNPAGEGGRILAFGAAVASIVSKEWLFRWNMAWSRRVKSSAMTANAWHHRSDALSSIPAAIAVGAASLGDHYGMHLWWLDSLGALVVCVMVVQAGWEVVKPTVSHLLDESAGRKVEDSVCGVVMSTPGVIDMHKLRTARVGPRAIRVDVHIFVEGKLTVSQGHGIAGAVKARLLAEVPDIVDVLVHVEPM